MNYLNLLQELLKDKIYTIKDTGLTYRQANHWRKVGLICRDRLKSAKTWSKFTFLEVFEIGIYLHLRELGVSLEKLLELKRLFYQPSHKIPDGVKHKDFFEYISNPLCGVFLLTVTAGENHFIVLRMITEDIFFVSEMELAELVCNQYGDANEDQFSTGFTAVSLRRLLDMYAIPYDPIESKLGKILKSIRTEKNIGSVEILFDMFGNISEAKLKKYFSLTSEDNLNKLVKKPSQKITFSSNNQNKLKVCVEEKIK